MHYDTFDYPLLQRIKELYARSKVFLNDPLPHFKIIQIKTECKELFGLPPPPVDVLNIDDDYVPPTIVQIEDVFVTNKKVSIPLLAQFHRYVSSLPQFENNPFFNQSKRLNNAAEFELFIQLCVKSDLNPLSKSTKELARAWNFNILANLLKQTDPIASFEFMKTYSLKTCNHINLNVAKGIEVFMNQCRSSLECSLSTYDNRIELCSLKNRLQSQQFVFPSPDIIEPFNIEQLSEELGQESVEVSENVQAIDEGEELEHAGDEDLDIGTNEINHTENRENTRPMVLEILNHSSNIMKDKKINQWQQAIKSYNLRYTVDDELEEILTVAIV